MRNKNLLSSYFSLFTSFGTILCCALPSLLVSIGMGAAFTSFISVFPQIVFLSEHKALVFIISGLVIFISAFMIYFNKDSSCTLDVGKADACNISRKWSVVILYASVGMWILGFFFSFLAPFLFI